MTDSKCDHVFAHIDEPGNSDLLRLSQKEDWLRSTREILKVQKKVNKNSWVAKALAMSDRELLLSRGTVFRYCPECGTKNESL